MSWGTCLSGSNNIHFDFPPLMSDGRNFASWQPGAKLNQQLRNENNIKSKKITGLLRKIYKPNMFKPENDLKNNIWFSINLNDMEKFTKTKYPNFVIFFENPEIKVPLPKKITIDVPNNHLKYAITWYSIAISILLYYLYFRKKK